MQWKVESREGDEKRIENINKSMYHHDRESMNGVESKYVGREKRR